MRDYWAFSCLVVAEGAAEVERVAPAQIPGIELSMDVLSPLSDSIGAEAKLQPMVTEYRKWIDEQQAKIPPSPPRRQETGNELMNRAKLAADRIEKGIKLLGIDSPGFEVPGNKALVNHHTLFDRDIPLIESLVNLDQLQVSRQISRSP